MELVEVTKDRFYEVIGPIEWSTHGATSGYVDGKWKNSWELKNRSGGLVARSEGNTIEGIKYYLTEKYV